MGTSKYIKTRDVAKHIRTLNQKLPRVEGRPNVPGEKPRQVAGAKHILAARNIISSIMDAHEELKGIRYLSDLHSIATPEEARIIKGLHLPSTVKMNITHIFRAILDPKTSQIELDSGLLANKAAFNKLSEQITSLKKSGILEKLGIHL